MHTLSGCVQALIMLGTYSSDPAMSDSGEKPTPIYTQQFISYYAEQDITKPTVATKSWLDLLVYELFGLLYDGIILSIIIYDILYAARVLGVWLYQYS